MARTGRLIIGPKAVIALAAESSLVVLTLGALYRDIRRHGPIPFQIPETVVSNANPPLPSYVPYLRFLGNLRPILKSGDRLSIVNCDHGLGDSYAYYIAVSQLPGQTVLPLRPALALDNPGELPDLTAVFGCETVASPWRDRVAVPGGVLLRKRTN